MTDNELIAEFMGQKGLTKVFREKIVPYIPAYDSLWDLLMPVCNKILTIYFTNYSVIQKEIRNDKSFIARMAVKQMFFVSDVTGQLEITSVYLKCVDFIKWYNKIQHKSL